MGSTIDTLVNWCTGHNLLLNASKTKEMPIKFSRTKSIDGAAIIEGECI